LKASRWWPLVIGYDGTNILGIRQVATERRNGVGELLGD